MTYVLLVYKIHRFSSPIYKEAKTKRYGVGRKIKPTVGDVVVDPGFEFCVTRGRETVLGIEDVKVLKPTNARDRKQCIIHIPIDDEQRVRIIQKDGRDPGRYKTEDISAFDPSRGKSEFVVISAHREDERYGYPNSWTIVLKRLSSEGKYDPSGEILAIGGKFAPSFTGDTSYISLNVIGHMDISFN